MMNDTDFTITARVETDNDGVQHVVHAISDEKGHAVAVGMHEADARAALGARSGKDGAVLVKKGALGRSADETTTVGALKGGS